jgi:hypothetical protein
MKKMFIVLAILALTACSNFPADRSSTGQVQHPDAFHSYVN